MDRIDELVKEVKSLRKEVELLRQEQNNTTYWRYDPSYTTYRPPQFPCEAGSIYSSCLNSSEEDRLRFYHQSLNEYRANNRLRAENCNTLGFQKVINPLNYKSECGESFDEME